MPLSRYHLTLHYMYGSRYHYLSLLASRFDSSSVRMSPSRTGPFTLRMMAAPASPMYAFIKPPSMEVLGARLRGRKTETEEEEALKVDTWTSNTIYS